MIAKFYSLYIIAKRLKIIKNKNIRYDLFNLGRRLQQEANENLFKMISVRKINCKNF